MHWVLWLPWLGLCIFFLPKVQFSPEGLYQLCDFICHPQPVCWTTLSGKHPFYQGTNCKPQGSRASTARQYQPKPQLVTRTPGLLLFHTTMRFFFLSVTGMINVSQLLSLSVLQVQSLLCSSCNISEVSTGQIAEWISWH